MGFIGASVAGYIGRSKIMGFLIGIFGSSFEALRFSQITLPEETVQPSKKHHEGIEELLVAKQMFDRGEISQAQYEDARAALTGKLNEEIMRP